MARIYCISNGVLLAFNAIDTKISSLKSIYIATHADVVFFKNQYDEWEYLKNRYSVTENSFITYDELKKDIIENFDVRSGDFKIRKITEKNLRFYFGIAFSKSPNIENEIQKILRENNVN